MGLQRHPNSSNWYYCFQIKGRRFYGSTGTSNRTLALQVERETRAKAHAASFLSVTETITLREALSLYCKARHDRQSGSGLISLSKKILGSTYDNRAHRIDTCFGLNGDVHIHNITTRSVERLLGERRSEGNAEQTIKHEVGLLRATCNEMKRLGYRTNPDIAWPRFKTKSRVRCLDPSEESALLIDLGPTTVLGASTAFEPLSGQKRRIFEMCQDNFDLVVFLLDTGCRYSEAATIPWSSIDLDENTIHLFRSKVQNESFLYMTDRLRDVLKRRSRTRRVNQVHVFENKAGHARGYTTKAIRKAIDRAGLNRPDVIQARGGRVTLHTLRHTYASKLVRKGLSLYDVSTLLGHSDSKMTQRYAHLAPSAASARAVAILNGEIS
jgi:site-specific recombinase XerD